MEEEQAVEAEALLRDFLSNFPKELRVQMEDYQNQYKETINKYYEKQPPFPPGRLPSDANIQADLAQIVELVAQCVVIGDADILYTWCITPLKEKQAQLASDNLGAYRQAIEDRKKSIATPEQEKFFLIILIEELERLERESLLAGNSNQPSQSC